MQHRPLGRGLMVPPLGGESETMIGRWLEKSGASR